MVDRRDTLKLAAGAMLGAQFAPAATAAQDDQPAAGFFVSGVTGSQEVPPVETDAEGGALFSLNADGSAVEYSLAVRNIENVSQAHLHQAPAGENGEVVVWLYPSPVEQSPLLISGRFDGILARGTIEAGDLVGPLEGESLETLVSAMAERTVYANVHTEQNPQGEIRGQVVPVAEVVEALGLEGAAETTAADETTPADETTAADDAGEQETTEQNQETTTQ